MIFNSVEFLLFIVLFFVLWPLFRKQNNSRWSFLVLASFIFYGWWDWRFLFLIIASGLVDYCAGIAIEKWNKRRRWFLGLSLLANLGSLAIFKYSTPFAKFAESLFGKLGLSIDLVNNIPEFALILPVGISFYTFQSMSYTIDVYRGRLSPTKNIIHFFAYLSMFPQLVAGPIIRAKHFLNQLNKYRIANSLEVWNGLKLVCFGFFQKVVIADNLSRFVDEAYQGSSIYDGPDYWWTVAFAFSFQIFCDFSGYSLIARGLAKLMGYHFQMNFNHPYLSENFTKFWRNWHISLSTWFRDYVYIPMGGSKKSFVAGAISLTVTFLLSGLWHGAHYTFMIWALLHIAFIMTDRILKKISFKAPYFVAIPIVFCLTAVAWVYFRAPDVAQANSVIKKMFSISNINSEFWDTRKNNLIALQAAFLIELVILLSRKFSSLKLLYKKWNLDVIVVIGCMVAILFFRGTGSDFIYFQF